MLGYAYIQLEILPEISLFPTILSVSLETRLVYIEFVSKRPKTSVFMLLWIK